MENTGEKIAKLEVGKFNARSWAVWGYIMRPNGKWSTGERIIDLYNNDLYNTRQEAKEAAREMAEYLKDYGWKVSL